MSSKAKNAHFRLSPVLIGIGLGMITLSVYLPSLGHKFLFYDDQQYVTENAHVITGLSLANFRWAFGYHAANWHPLTWISHMLDCQIYGLNPAGHHLTNILLHATNTALLFLVLNMATNRMWPSAIVAGLFGWHPLHVESVAWVAERKDLLCALFWMLTLWAYVKHARLGSSIQYSVFSVQSGQERRLNLQYYGLILIFFSLSLMSKPMAVTLPFVLLLLDYWPLQRLQSEGIARHVWQKAPLFGLSAIGCFLTVGAQQKAIISTAGLPVPERIGHAAIAYVHYVCALVFPQHLAVYYPFGQFISSGAALAALASLLAATLFVLYYLRQKPFLPVGWFWFIGTLVPVIGLVQVGDQAWADRYTYLPSIGFFIILVWGALDLATRLSAAALKCRLEWLIPTTVCVLCIALTEKQLGYWKDTRTLFERARGVTKNNTLAITLLGSLDAQAGNIDAALKQYDEALQVKPTYPEAHFFKANALDKQGKLDDAISEYRKVLWYGPVREQAHILLAGALVRSGRPQEAATNYEAALKLDPDSAIAHNNLARLLQTAGKTSEAMSHYAAALKLDPQLAEAHNNYGVLLVQSGHVVSGVAQMREGLRYNPENLQTKFNLALALNELGNWPEAAEIFSKILRPDAHDPKLHYQYGLALEHLGKTRDAMGQYAAALLASPDFVPALNRLAWIISTSRQAGLRNGQEALQMSQSAVRLTKREDPEILKTFSAALAENGKFDEAAKAASQALTLAESRRLSLTNVLRSMMASFADLKPWRE